MFIRFPGGLCVCTAGPGYVHQFLHGGFCYVHSFGCVLQTMVAGNFDALLLTCQG